MSILVVGSIAIDSVETPYGSAPDSPGGSALYFSAAASIFAQVNIVGVIGDDFQQEYIDFFKSRPVNTDGIYTAPGKTFRWGGKYYSDPNQRDTLFTDLNVFQDFNPDIPQAYKESEYIFLANIAPELQLRVLEQAQKPKLVVLDTMNFWIEGSRTSLLNVIKKTDVLIVNDEETKQLTGEHNVISAGRQILTMGPAYLIIKQGEHGAILMDRNSLFNVPAFPVSQVVDPTGAGDSFAGGFLGYLAQESDINEKRLRRAVVYGTAVASFCVEDFSYNKLKVLTRGELDQRVEFLREMTVF